jgi:hypothetical protein
VSVYFHGKSFVRLCTTFFTLSISLLVWSPSLDIISSLSLSLSLASRSIYAVFPIFSLSLSHSSPCFGWLVQCLLSLSLSLPVYTHFRFVDVQTTFTRPSPHPYKQRSITERQHNHQKSFVTLSLSDDSVAPDDHGRQLSRQFTGGRMRGRSLDQFSSSLFLFLIIFLFPPHPTRVHLWSSQRLFLSHSCNRRSTHVIHICCQATTRQLINVCRLKCYPFAPPLVSFALSQTSLIRFTSSSLDCTCSPVHFNSVSRSPCLSLSLSLSLPRNPSNRYRYRERVRECLHTWPTLFCRHLFRSMHQSPLFARLTRNRI